MTSIRLNAKTATARIRQRLVDPPRLWPRFRSPLRSPALTARIGTILGATFLICFATGLLSHYQYSPWSWLPEPAHPVWGYRLTQGVHVITGIAAIPLLLVKLWSVYHRLWIWPGIPSLVVIAERLSIAVLVSTSLVQLVTGLMNVLQWYSFDWNFVPVHYWLSWIIIGSLLLHIAVKLPVIRTALSSPVTEPVPVSADPEGEQEPELNVDGPSRRGVLVGAGAGVGLVVLTTVGQTVPALEPIALLAPRQPSKGPQDLPVNRTAAAARVTTLARSADYSFAITGRNGFTLTLAELEALPTHSTTLPIACVEGWSRSAAWRGPRLLDLVLRAGGTHDSSVTLISLEQGTYASSHITGSQLHHAVLATHLNGERLNLDHGYPLRLIAPDRSGVLQTKWLKSMIVHP